MYAPTGIVAGHLAAMYTPAQIGLSCRRSCISAVQAARGLRTNPISIWAMAQNYPPTFRQIQTTRGTKHHRLRRRLLYLLFMTRQSQRLIFVHEDPQHGIFDAFFALPWNICSTSFIGSRRQIREWRQVSFFDARLCENMCGSRRLWTLRCMAAAIRRR